MDNVCYVKMNSLGVHNVECNKIIKMNNHYNVYNVIILITYQKENVLNVKVLIQIGIYVIR